MYGDDRLLRTRSIAELRELVQNLHEKAGSKKEELQLMVGSKYHEFIQSADTITTMKEDSDRLREKLAGFSDICTDLVAQMKSLLVEHEGESNLSSGDKTSKEKKQGKGLQEVNTNLLDITSSAVWACLDKCDVYTAAKTIIIAEVLKSARDGTDSLSKNAFVSEFFQDKTLDINVVVSSNNDDDYMKHDLASFLADTVVEDGFLILLNNEANIDLKAEIIASLGILSGKSSFELLKGFLHVADIVMEDIITSLQTGSLTAAANEQDEMGATASKFLLKLVSCLQEIILDVHVLFFPSHSSDLKDKNTLVGRYQIRFLHELNKQFEHHLGRSHILDVDTVIAELEKKSIDTIHMKDMRDIFGDWFHSAVRKVTTLSDRALSTMHSAADVSHLQNQVWKIATYSGVQSPSFTIEDWNMASLKLLVPANESRGYSKTDAGSLLWSSALRPPFISHVERLLRSSCVIVLLRTKEKLLDCLREGDIAVDASSLDLALDADAQRGDPFLDSSRINREMFGSSGPRKPRMTSASIFKMAEDVRTVFEAEIMGMLSEVKSDPSNELRDGHGGSVGVSDPQSHTALTKAVFIQSTQLIGHFLILLRTLSEKFIKAIDKRRIEVTSTSNKSTGAVLFSVPFCGDKRIGLQSASGLSNNDLYHDEEMANLLSGLLLLGRISWCLKHRGSRLWNAIEAQKKEFFRDQEEAQGAGAFKRYDLSSEDQLRSAFEIADANGDGILRIDEAIEAIQAINVSSYKTASSLNEEDSSVFEFLSSTLTPSLSLHELALMCGDLLTPEATIPVARCHLCLDSLIEQAHVYWSEVLTKDLARSLASNLSVELGADADGVGVGVGIGVCKSLWKKTSLHLEDGPDEVVEIPTSCSSSLSSFLTLLSARAAYGIFSVDTTQEILSHSFLLEGWQSSNGEGGGIIDSCLANNIFHDLRRKAVPCVLRAYSSVYKSILTSSSSATSSATSAAAKKQIETWREDCALQVLFDLNVIEKVADQEYLNTKNGHTMIRKSIDTWKTLIDPINLELLLPAVNAQVDDHLSSSKSILAGAKVFGPVTVTDKDGEVPTSISNNREAKNEGTTKKSDVFFSVNSPKLALLPSSISTAAVNIIMTNAEAVAVDNDGKEIASTSSFSSSTTLLPSSNTEDELSEGDTRENLNIGKYLSFFNS